jgi:hypothetical protein
MVVLVTAGRPSRLGIARGVHSSKRTLCRSVASVDFSRELRDDVLAGDITVSFRLWRRAKVRVGGRYRVGSGEIQVDSVDLVPFSSIDGEDLRRSGHDDLESLRRRAAHAGPIDLDTLVYRVEFHVVED